MHMGLSYNGGPAALLHKTVFYWHLVFECELRQPRKIIVPLHTSRSLYSHTLNSLDLYARTKLCTSPHCNQTHYQCLQLVQSTEYFTATK